MTDLDQSFDTLQQNVNADPEIVREARDRRGVFSDALSGEPDVDQIIFIGSIARGSQIEPIKDVDLAVVYGRDDHRDWGTPGGSAADAIEHAREQVVRLLSADGTHTPGFVRLARPGNHSLKCFLDDPDDEDAFTVDAVPALRNEDGTLLIPETESADWIRTHPEHLNQCVKDRNDDWRYFVPLVRDLKRWNRDHGESTLALLLEVLALDHLPALQRSQALAKFFAAAVPAIDSEILDPAGISPIQPDLDKTAAREQLQEAADLSWRAVVAEDRGETDRAACYWHKLFGDIFPEPEGGCSRFDGNQAALAGLAGVSSSTQHRRPIRDTPQG